jgi:signal transduction histidine kinase
VNSGLGKNDVERVEAGWRMVQKYVEQVSALVRNLLRYARAQRPSRSEVAPGDLVAEVIQLYESKAALVGIELIAEVADGMPTLWVDREAIAASLTNLVSNAMDACTWDPDLDKPHRIGVAARPLEPPAGDGSVWVRLEVADNGMGIAVENQHKILRAFFTTKGMSGTGLGLLLTKKAVEEHAGRISFTSTHGQGATFCIDLPVVDASEREANGNDGAEEVVELASE